MKAGLVIPVTLSLLATALMGCGEEDAIYGSDGSSNVLTVSSFDRSYDNLANASAIARIDKSYRTGARDIKVQNIVNNYNNQGLNSLDKIVVADNFEGSLENTNIIVNNRTVKRPIYEKNSNRQLSFETTYKTLDLSGLKANSYSAGNTVGSSRGIITDLNNYPNISANVSFPAGSVCYIPVITSERAFLSFNGKNKTGYQSLDKWIAAAEDRFSDNRDSSTSRFGIGVGNAQDAAQVRFFEFRNQPAYRYTGVEYDDDIYEADYIADGTTNLNTDSFRGVVDCTVVNDVAADFLAEQIADSYRSQ